MQLALLFDDSPIPEARVNDSGVLLGPGLIRQWWPDQKRRDVARIVVRRIGGEYCYGVDIDCDGGGCGFSPSLKWNRFFSLPECISDAMRNTEKRIRDALELRYNDLPKAGAKKLLAAFERGEFTETIEGEL